MPVPITEDLVRRLAGGTKKYEQLTNETYKPGSSSTLFDELAPVATSLAEGILMIGYDDVDRIRALIATDVAVQHAIARICLGLMGQTKTEMYDHEKGNYPFRLQEEQGRDDLDKLARAQVQSPAQQDNADVGQHDRTKSGNVKKASNSPKIFNPSCPGSYGKGGF